MLSLLTQDMMRSFNVHSDTDKKLNFSLALGTNKNLGSKRTKIVTGEHELLQFVE